MVQPGTAQQSPVTTAGNFGYTLGWLAKIGGCTVAGDPELLVTGVCDPKEAGPGDLVFLVDDRYRESIQASSAGFVLAKETLDGRPCLLT
ncbi:MAG: hypothetical protein HY692_00845, partial [Cyanobacteria bacterium NC_groundwater_1444_Ag_S-0.65um_54_12]|nr:hypothetical protein [Cyanobacteria bacterium NC_groundwater_1444_Ag_S-0.65um_54_12]